MEEQELADTLANWQKRAIFDNKAASVREFRNLVLSLLAFASACDLLFFWLGLVSRDGCYGAISTIIGLAVIVPLIANDLITKARKA